SLEQSAPVGGGAAVERVRRHGPILRQRLRLDLEHPAGVGEPVAPEGGRVAEHAVQIGQQRRHRRRLPGVSRGQASTPAIAPTVSIPTSSGAPWRPSTNTWCTSSVTAYKAASAT